MTPPRGKAGAPRRLAAPAREVAVRVLERVEADASFADLALEHELAARRLSPATPRWPWSSCTAPSAGSAISTGSWRPHSRRRLETLDARVRVILRVTAYQIALLDRVPSFAAVNDAVTLAPGTPGVKPFVNAVLRSFARRAPREREPAAPRDPVDALATRCSFPTWLAARWVARIGREEAEALMRASNERPPLTLRANALRDRPRRARRAPGGRRGPRRAADAPCARGARGGAGRRAGVLARVR